MDFPERRLSNDEIETLKLPLQNDLIAVFGVIGDEADRLLDEAVREGWTPERLIDEIVRLIDGDNRAPETVAVPELQELNVNKSRLNKLQVIQKSLETMIVLKAGKPIGATSERKDGTYKKVGEGDWEKTTESETKTEHSEETKTARGFNPKNYLDYKEEMLQDKQLNNGKIKKLIPLKEKLQMSMFEDKLAFTDTFREDGALPSFSKAFSEEIGKPVYAIGKLNTVNGKSYTYIKAYIDGDKKEVREYQVFPKYGVIGLLDQYETSEKNISNARDDVKRKQGGS